MPSWTTSPAESMLRISRNSLSVSLMPVSIHTTGKLKQAAQIIATSRAVNTGGPHGRWPEGAAGSLMERIKAWTRIDGLTVHGAWRGGGGWGGNGARGGTRRHMALRGRVGIVESGLGNEGRGVAREFLVQLSRPARHGVALLGA